VKQVRAEVKRLKDAEKQREQAKAEKTAKNVWKQLIKAIVTRKYISDTYKH
jgi:hypothetical protein